MKTIKLGLAAAALMASAAALAKGGAQDCVAGRADKAVPDYAPGETMTFTVEVRGFAEADKSQWQFKWERTADDGKKETGVASAAQPFAYRTSLDRPGFVRFQGWLLDGAGKPVRKVNGRGRQVDVRFDLGAGVEIGKIRQGVPEPKDFDALWAKHKANLASVAWKDGVTLKEIASPTAGVRLYEFSVPCFGGKPATGHLSVPGDTSRKYPAVARFFGYNESWTYKRAIVPPENLPRGEIMMRVSAHGFEMGRDETYYKEERTKVKSNGFGHGFDPVQNADPEKTYYAGMTYRLMRALEYLKTRPEWNGRDLTVTGGSQGALQSIWAAALVPGVSRCNISIPWNCDIGGTEVGRNRGDWYVKWVPALGYYDTCNMAPRIPKSCVVEVTAGLGDYTCPPTGVMAFYNALVAPKSIVFTQNMEHGNGLQGAPVQRFRIDGDKISPGL